MNGSRHTHTAAHRTLAVLGAALAGCATGPGAAPAVAPALPPGVEFFAPGTITLGAVTTYRPSFTPDGRTVVFTVGIGGNEYALAAAERRGGRWGTPGILPFSGRYSDAEAVFSPDGRRLVFASKRPTGGDGPRPDYDLWIVDRSPDGGWGTPRHLGAEVNTDVRELYPSLGGDGTLYFTRSGPNGADLWYARPSGDGFAPAEKLPPPIDSDRAEAGSYVSADGRMLLFESTREGGLGGTDLWLSCRGPEGWGAPRRLPAPVNSPGPETSATLSPDGRTLYFGSGRRLESGPKLGAGLSFAEIVRRSAAPGSGVQWHTYQTDAERAGVRC